MEERLFRDICGTFTTGVTVVTTRDGDGAPVGMTVNSFTSLSLTPPLLLITIAKNASLYNEFLNTSTFVVNILAAHQEDISRTFATKNIDRFASIAFYDGNLGMPILEEVLGYLECRVSERHHAGDHTILVGEVVNGGCSEDKPLVFYRGQYADLQEVLLP